MAMGSTGRVVLSDEMQKAKAVCADFRATVTTFSSDLESTVNSLLSAGFQGDAADGFKEFYEKNVRTFLDAGGTFDQFLSMFDKDGEGLFDSIEKALVLGEGLDPKLGENNRSIGQSDGQAE